MADLCCGIGGDLVALAADRPVRAVDLDPVHLGMAQANADAYDVGANVQTVRIDVRDADLSGVDAVYVDPARRADGHRLPTGSSEPPLDWCWALIERVPVVGVKAAPGGDGLAGDVDDLRRRLKLTGSLRATLVMTRVEDRPWGLVCLDDERSRRAGEGAPPGGRAVPRGS